MQQPPTTFKEMRRILQDYDANPYELNRAGERMLEIMAETHAAYNDIMNNLGAEEEEREQMAVVPANARIVRPSTPLLPTPTRRLRFDDTPSPQILVDAEEVDAPPRRRSRLNLVTARPRRLFADSPSMSPAESASWDGVTTPERQPPAIPQAPARPRRRIQFDRTGFQPIRLSFDETPERSSAASEASEESLRTPQRRPFGGESFSTPVYEVIDSGRCQRAPGGNVLNNFDFSRTPEVVLNSVSRTPGAQMNNGENFRTPIQQSTPLRLLNTPMFTPRHGLISRPEGIFQPSDEVLRTPGFVSNANSSQMRSAARPPIPAAPLRRGRGIRRANNDVSVVPQMNDDSDYD